MFDNDDKLKELEEAEVVYYSPKTLENIRSKQFLDGRSVDWNCCGQIILSSELAGQSRFVNVSCISCSSERFYFRHHIT